MTGDEQQNYEAIYRWLNGSMGLEELSVPSEALKRISPMYFFEDITARSASITDWKISWCRWVGPCRPANSSRRWGKQWSVIIMKICRTPFMGQWIKSLFGIRSSF